MNARAIFVSSSVSVVIAVAVAGYFWPHAWYSMIVIAPIILIGIRDMVQKNHTIKRNFPVIGNFRYLLEAIRPEMMQYFVETDTEGKPFNRLQRSIVYRRAKKVNDTTPFGTQMNVYASGYEWMDHSIYANPSKYYQKQPRVLIGGPDCKQAYFASLLNVSAMSYGALSNAAISALNLGAKKNKFAHNTGEGGLSDYHLLGGDVIWQIGTGYFGARDKEGNFNDEEFRKRAILPQVKMIEIKISQGAKPGHGGLLPAAKNTPEIAKIRGIEPFKDVHSPPTHSAFSNPKELLLFIKKLRELSGGKPVGFKLCIGKKREFVDICQAMIENGITPDFITVDGGEGGTGAAPMEFSSSMGMPMRDGVAFVSNILTGLDLKKDIKIIASGKVITGFDIVRALALGADLVNSARGMMLAIGCIQALQCNTNTCPVGVATQDKKLIKGLDVPNKADRVANFHEATLKSFVELTAAAGIQDPENIRREHINRRIGMNNVMKYSDIFPYIETGSLLQKEKLDAYLKSI
jgi:glutamate synthase domain-containing protein 2